MKKSYQKYRKTQNGWLPSLPAEWLFIRNKAIFQEISELSTSGKETLLTVSHITGVTPRSEKSVNMFFAESMEGYKVCAKGDLIINTMWAWMGALGTSKYEGICSPAYNVYRAHQEIPYNPQYFDYLFRTPNFIVEMTRNSKGIVSSRLRLYPREFYQIHSPLPPLKTQNAIVEYLNRHCRAFDRKVAELEKKISAYKELRQSLIDFTMTNGLSRRPKKKRSGVPYLGEIPTNWTVCRLKDLGTLETSSVDKKIVDGEALVKLVNYTDVYDNQSKEIRGNKDYMMVSAKPQQIKEKGLEMGDVLFTPSSETIEEIGLSAVVMEDLHDTIYSYHLVRLRFTTEINTRFKKYLFNNSFVQFYFSSQCKGTTRKILGLGDFSNLQVAYPTSPSEQKEIADFLDHNTSRLNKVIAKLRVEIDRIKELKNILILDVTTGKIKV